jgi:hypothetical protein
MEGTLSDFESIRKVLPGILMKWMDGIYEKLNLKK